MAQWIFNFTKPNCVLVMIKGIFLVIDFYILCAVILCMLNAMVLGLGFFWGFGFLFLVR